MKRLNINHLSRKFQQMKSYLHEIAPFSNLIARSLNSDQFASSGADGDPSCAFIHLIKTEKFQFRYVTK